MTPAEPEKANLIASPTREPRCELRHTIPIPEPPGLHRPGQRNNTRSPQYRICHRVGRALAPSPSVRRKFSQTAAPGAMPAVSATLAQGTCFRTTANVWNFYAQRSG
jgi:hypothetical protein